VQATPGRRSPPWRHASRTIVSSGLERLRAAVTMHGLTQRYRTARSLELDQASERCRLCVWAQVADGDVGNAQNIRFCAPRQLDAKIGDAAHTGGSGTPRLKYRLRQAATL
jgi:hypothetical protein